MNKTIDVKGLEHGKREELIFPTIEEIKEGDTLRILVEFNPVPLVYMLKAREEFDVSYEKEGPDEWILNVKRFATMVQRKEQFKQLLKELKQGEVSEKAKENAKQLLQAVDAKTLGFIEQELIREGVSHEDIRRSLCDIHLEVLKDSLVSKQIKVGAPHPVHTFMEEHKIILENLNELGSLVGRLQGKKNFEESGNELEKLKDVSHLLVEAENHHQREQDVLFPTLRKHDIVEPPDIMEEEHADFKKKKQELYKISQNPGDYKFEDLKKQVTELGNYLTERLESHIFKEDNILYQIALQVLSQKEWDEVKKACDKMGYCCYSPQC